MRVCCEREKEVFFCVFFFLFLCCFLFVFFLFVVVDFFFCLCNDEKLKQLFHRTIFTTRKIESLYLLLAFITLVSKKSQERERRERRERESFLLSLLLLLLSTSFLGGLSFPPYFERERERVFVLGNHFRLRWIKQQQQRERKMRFAEVFVLLLYLLLHRTIILLSEEGLIMRGVNREENW